MYDQISKAYCCIMIESIIMNKYLTTIHNALYVRRCFMHGAHACTLDMLKPKVVTT